MSKLLKDSINQLGSGPKAGALHFHERFIYYVGGARVRTNRRCDLPQTDQADVEVCIQFIQPDYKEDRLRELLSRCFRLEHYLSTETWMTNDGKFALVVERVPGLERSTQQVRRLVPYAAALQGKVTLHASAVMTGDRIAAFIGASGAGKSTLAGALDLCGYRRVADDLLPVRLGRGRATAMVSSGTRSQLVPFSSIYFLSRQRGLESPMIDAVEARESLRLFIHNGFGEVRQRSAWTVQFCMYGELARHTLGYELKFPDDERQFARHLAILEQHLQKVSLSHTTS